MFPTGFVIFGGVGPRIEQIQKSVDFCVRNSLFVCSKVRTCYLV